jgi:hypothetical protein
MVCREITAVCSEIHTKRINKLCEQHVEFFERWTFGSELTLGFKGFRSNALSLSLSLSLQDYPTEWVTQDTNTEEFTVVSVCSDVLERMELRE